MTGGPATLAGLRPLAGAGGLLNLTVPLAALTGTSAAPGQLSRLGVITPAQARQLAGLAAAHPSTRWRIIITDQAGRAIAVTNLPRPRASAHGPPGSDHSPPGLIGRVSLIIPASAARAGPGRAPPSGSPAHGTALAAIADRALAAAAQAVHDADQRIKRDQRAGGCAHDLATDSYRPPPRIADLVAARDRTCRFRTCRRPAEQCDLDHTIPHHLGGPTCSCNIGGGCRAHHVLKQHPRWTLTQPAPGTFRWTTPTGRTYMVRPDPYL